MKRLGFGGLLFVLALAFLFLAFDALIATSARAADTPALSDEHVKKCREDAATAIVALLETGSDAQKKNVRQILTEQLRLTTLKLAQDTLKSKRLVVEELVQLKSKKLNQADANGVRGKLEEIYKTYGFDRDLETIAKRIPDARYVLKKPGKKQWDARFTTNEIGAYVQLRHLMDQSKSGRKIEGVKFSNLDAAVLWFQSAVTGAMEAQKKDRPEFARGKAVRNLAEVSTQVAFLTGYVKDSKNMTVKQLEAELSRPSAFNESYAAAMDAVKNDGAKLSKECRDYFAKMNCTECTTAVEREGTQQGVTLEIVKQILEKMKSPGAKYTQIFIDDLVERAKKGSVQLEEADQEAVAEIDPRSLHPERKAEGTSASGASQDSVAVKAPADDSESEGDDPEQPDLRQSPMVMDPLAPRMSSLKPTSPEAAAAALTTNPPVPQPVTVPTQAAPTAGVEVSASVSEDSVVAADRTAPAKQAGKPNANANAGGNPKNSSGVAASNRKTAAATPSRTYIRPGNAGGVFTLNDEGLMELGKRKLRLGGDIYLGDARDPVKGGVLIPGTRGCFFFVTRGERPGGAGGGEAFYITIVQDQGSNGTRIISHHRPEWERGESDYFVPSSSGPKSLLFIGQGKSTVEQGYIPPERWNWRVIIPALMGENSNRPASTAYSELRNNCGL